MFEPVTTSTTPLSGLLGLLRSGHGEGARLAVHADRASVIAALDSCVLHDPRPAPSCESRSLYYARLYTELGARLDAVESHLFADADWTDDDPDRTSLPLAVLGALARSGRTDAVALLRRYAADGRDWADAVARLADCAARGDAAALDGMLAVALERAEDDDELYDCVQAATDGMPWRTWAAQDARVREVVERVDLDWWRWEIARARPADPADPSAPSVPTVDEVLAEAAVTPRRSTVCGRRLAAVARPEHRGLILATAWSGAEGARVAALAYLGEQDDPAVLDLAEDALADGTPRAVRCAAAQAASRQRSADAVARARAWLLRPEEPAARRSESAGDTLRDVAVRILAAAGDACDGPALIAALEREGGCRRAAVARGPRAVAGASRVGDLVDGIGRLGLAEGLASVRDVYRDNPSAGVRSRAVEALAAIEPEFASTTAVECLWDCEESTRLAGARRVDTAVPGVRERLRVLACDAAEKESVREAARRRLAV